MEGQENFAIAHCGSALGDESICPSTLVILLAVPCQVISTARTCDLIFIVLDCLKPLTHKRIIERELEGFGIRLNKKEPKITFK